MIYVQKAQDTGFWKKIFFQNLMKFWSFFGIFLRFFEIFFFYGSVVRAELCARTRSPQKLFIWCQMLFQKNIACVHKRHKIFSKYQRYRFGRWWFKMKVKVDVLHLVGSRYSSLNHFLIIIFLIKQQLSHVKLNLYEHTSLVFVRNL